MINKFLAFAQRLVAADKAGVTAAVLAGLSLLCVHFGMHLNASVMTYLGVLASVLVGAFLHAHFAAKANK